MGGYQLPEWIRISIGTPAQNERCLDVLKTALGKVKVQGGAANRPVREQQRMRRTLRNNHHLIPYQTSAKPCRQRIFLVSISFETPTKLNTNCETDRTTELT
jgi:hypothetical protein